MPEKSEGGKPKLFLLTCIFAFVLLVFGGASAFALWEKSVVIQWVPAYVLQWGFCGGMVAVLFRVSILRGSGLSAMTLYSWAVAKPIMGTVMGGLVYLLAVSGELALNGMPEGDKPIIKNFELLCGLAFLGGFSDRFGIDLLKRFAGKWAGDDQQHLHEKKSTELASDDRGGERRHSGHSTFKADQGN